MGSTRDGKLSLDEVREDQKAEEHIKEIRRKLREAQKVDLAFLMDATGSMGPLIKALKVKIVEIAKGVKQAFPEEGELRFSCVYYRDYDADIEEPRRYERRGICCDFTHDVTEFQKKLGGLEAWGGADDPEDVFSGLEQLLELKWAAPATRIVYHIADAPCHGRRFHDPEYAKNHEDTAFTLERFKSEGATSEDDPEGRKIEVILRRLAEEAKISTYTFLHIHSREKGGRPKTAKMLEEFRKANDEGQKPGSVGIDEHIVEMLAHGRGPEAMKALAECLLRVVEKGVKSIVKATMNDIVNKPSSVVVSSSSRIAAEMRVDVTIPTDWSTLPIHRVFCHRSAKYDTVGAMLAQIEQGAPLHFRVNKSAPIHVHIAPHPFTSACRTRWPFYAKMQVGPNSWKLYVMKRFKFVDYGSLTDYPDPCKNPYQEVMETYDIASKLASQFYANIIDKNALHLAKKLYLALPLTTCKVADSKDCFTMETFHEGARWIKVDAESEYYETLQTFSHWTHVYSDDLLMVIVQTLIMDGETPDKEPRALLCDPSIHSKKFPRRFKRTNTGEVGIEFFYNNHKCNELCKVLEL